MIKKFNKWWEKECCGRLEKLNNWYLLVIFLLTAVFMVFLFVGLVCYIKSVGFNIWTIPVITAVVIIIFIGLGFIFGISGLMEARINKLE